MNPAQWWAPVMVLVIFWQFASLVRSNERLQKRVRDLEIRLSQLQDHVGFVPDPNSLITEQVRMLARTPGSKIAAIKLYREQTGAGLREAKEAVERMEKSQTGD